MNKCLLFVYVTFYLLVLVSETTSTPSANTGTNNSSFLIKFDDRHRRNSVISNNGLVKSTECLEFANFCRASGDLELLSCIYGYKDDKGGGVTVPSTCLAKLKTFVPKFIKGSVVRDLAYSHCAKVWTTLDCENRSPKGGGLIACLMDKISSIQNPECSEFVQKLKILPFLNVDSLMVFMDDCINVKSLCFKNQQQVNNPSEIMTCMQGMIEQLTVDCRDQILSLSELQLETPTIYQALYTVCEKERILYCSDQQVDDVDQLYRCLVSHREDKISPKCNEELYRHAKIIVRDFQASRGLSKACKEDIRFHQCRKSVSNHKFVRLSQILICLENASLADPRSIKPGCEKEMVKHRQMLMEDYRLSPELVTRCSDEIQHLCSRVSTGGRVIHCLMENSRPGKGNVSPKCQRELELLVKQADIVDNWSVDPVLRQTCRDVVTVACRNVPVDKVMSCLMEKLGSTMMTENCENALLQIQYFVARDYKLDGQLYRACHKDAVSKCKAARDWAHGVNDATDPERGPLVLPCLYRRASIVSQDDKDRLSDGCIAEIHRVMKERALSVELHPEVEMACLQDLAVYCVDKTAHRQEIDCLQQHFEQLGQSCQIAVYNFTEIQTAHLELNPIIMTNCEQIINSLCKSFFETNSVGDVMECLIDHKNHQLMKYNTKCKAAVDHFQLISLKDYHFTLKFKEACKVHVSRFCSGSSTKAQVVACLSEVMRNDTLTDHKQRIPKDCRQQVRAQLLQSKENINYNPSLRMACGRDVEKYCRDVQPGNANVLECLERHRKELTGECHKMVFRTERDDLMDSSTDYKLMTTCKAMITKYCSQGNDSANPLSCLKKFKYQAEFDPNCRLIVVRRMIEQFSDVRLNPGLMSSCREDIARHCAAVIANQQSEEAELDGKVTNCLKNKFRERGLTKDCEKKLIVVLQESALNYQLNPLLSSLCQVEIEKLCKKETEKDQLGGGGVEECLKRNLLEGTLSSRLCRMEVVELIRESKADIQADPLLHSACLHDLNHFCSDVSKGDSRKLSCLIKILELDGKSKKLQPDCKTMLSERIEMYKMQKQISVENLEQLYNQVTLSPSKRYFFVAALTFVGMVFMSGMFCGRMVRRSHVALKNK